MDAITEFFKLDIATFVLTIFVILSACIAIHDIIGRFSKIIGKPVKWVREKEKDHELLMENTKQIKELSKLHEEDREQSIKHDEKIESNLDSLLKMVLDKAIDDYRYEILDFATGLSNGKEYNREAFNHIFRIYEKYEKILKQNNMENGLVEESIKFIRKKYNELLNNGELN